MTKLDDLLGKGIEFPKTRIEMPFLRFIQKRIQRSADMSDLTPAAQEVLSEVITTLRVSQLWYAQNDGIDGTTEMYAVDVINRLRTVYNLPKA